jgi:hypothetical protein
MTRDELLELLGFLANVRNSEYVADEMMHDECDRLIELIKKEIESKHYKLGDI